MSPDERTEIERRLGRRIAEGERASLRDLNALPESLKHELSLLAPMERAVYLRFLVLPEERQFLKRYTDDIFDRGVDPAEWRRGGAVFPDYTEAELLGRDVPAILAPLEWHEGEAWARVKPILRQWEVFDTSVGMPLIVRAEMTYRHRAAPHAGRLFPPFVLPNEPILDVAIAIRRWLATRVAQRARARMAPDARAGWERGLAEAHSVEDLLRRAGFEAIQPSRDATLALEALRREVARSDLATVEPPGFRGPDDWYVG